MRQAPDAEAIGNDLRYVRTVQQTGKRFKANMLFGVFLILLGVVGIVVSVNAEVLDLGPDVKGPVALVSVLSILVGLIWWLVSRFAAWWHHG